MLGVVFDLLVNIFLKIRWEIVFNSTAPYRTRNWRIKSSMQPVHKGIKYLFAGVKTYNVELKSNGYYYRGPVIAVINANIAKYGRIMKVAPGATLNDGKIWVSVARPTNRVLAIIECLTMIIGKQHIFKKVDVFQTDRINIKFLEDIATQQDGEVYRYPRGTEIEVSVEKDALTVLKPLPSTTRRNKKKVSDSSERLLEP